MAEKKSAGTSGGPAWQAPPVADYERLGAFYLGRPYDLAAKSPEPGLILYDSKDLVTHAICVGMTGSGKTGLCIDLIEEAALDGVPTIVIDPKGDLANLMLTFPELRPEDFRPWIDESEAARKGVGPDEFAAEQAALWRDGLASWGQDGARIGRLRAAADFAVYTPGSRAGIPLSILRSFAAPPEKLRADEEALRDRVSGAATGLLTLVGIEADPVQSREHILVSTLLARAWQRGEDLDLAGLIDQLESPPVERIGAMELERFFPAKARRALATRLNGILAAPGFQAWLEGEPMDPGALLRTPAGKPRVSIISIAHLTDAERMFFVTLLLGEVIAWMRTQSGTSSLRAILYMDEIFGYFPPVAEPPSKRPLLTLLKQARAYGLGVVLATQNPVDLDYKGLANTGTWLVGRLQTDRDKSRLLDGLEGASTTAGAAFDRAAVERTIGGLGKRVFLMSNVHEDAPVVFESRWAMSYLRGPLTRQQIATLMEGRRPVERPAAAPDAAAATAAPASAAAATEAPASAAAATEAPAPAAAAAAVVDADQHRRERRDAAIETLRKKFAPKLSRAQEKARNAAQVVEREQGQARGAQVQTAVSVGATVLGALFGRKLGSGTVGRGTTAARGAARALEQQQDVARAKEDLAAAEQELARLETELQAELAKVATNV